MSKETVARLFVQRFLTNFGPPKTISGPVAHPEAFFAEYQRALGGTDDDVLREAAAYVIDHHGYPMRWPTVAECKAAVDHIASEQGLARARRGWGKYSAQSPQEPTPESKARVDTLMRECLANLKTSGPPPGKVVPLPDVSRDAWERRFGRPSRG